MVITLWKDIPYATALLLFSLQILRVIFSDGEWLKKWGNCVWMALTGLCVMLFRHNGFPVPVLSLLVVGMFYRRYWVRLGVIIICMIFTWVVIRGPVYDSLGVSKNSGAYNQIFIHHISAHIAKGGPLTPEEARIANLILPENGWKYDCCTSITVHDPAEFEKYYQTTAVFSGEIKNIFIGLAFKEPGVELQHLKCVSQPVWNIGGSCGVWLTNIISHNRLVAENSYGIRADSKFPSIKKYLMDVYMYLYNTQKLRFYWYPIIYLILAIIGSITLSFWYGKKKAILFAVPALIQSVILALFNVNATDFRYQYGVILIGLFSLGLIILAINQKFMAQKSLSNEGP